MEVTITAQAEQVIRDLFICYLLEHPRVDATNLELSLRCFNLYVDHILRDIYEPTEPIEWEVD